MTTYSLSLSSTSGLLEPWFDSWGQSVDAAKIHQALDIAAEPGPSVLLGSRFQALWEAVEEASEEDWDGYGAMAANPEAYQRAYIFLKALPKTIPDPEITIDPDGEISFDWYHTPRMTFSVSVGPSGRLSYAGLYGKRTNYGTEFITEGLPKPILDNLGRLHSHIPATQAS